MPPNPEYPPWMGPQPPPGASPPPQFPPPPPPQHAWPGPPPPPRPGSGLATAIGVLNLVFALGCGCTSLLWAVAWETLHEEPDQLTAPLVQWMRQSKELSIEVNSRKVDTEALRAVWDEAAKTETVESLMEAISRSPATPTIRTATMAAGLAQAALFVGSILLLMRRNTGRVLSILALMVYLGATIATMIKFEDPAEQMAAVLKERVTSSAGYRALSENDREEADRVLSIAPQGLQATLSVTSAFTMIWPAIALLILFASRSIKDACAPTYGGAARPS
jgi:hypothetical protein